MDSLYYVVLTEVVISSIIVCLLIITIIIGKRYTTLFYQSLTIFSLISLIHSISFIINWPTTIPIINTSLCKAQSFIMITSQLSQLLWMSLINFMFYNSMKQTQAKVEKAWHILIYFLICTIIPIGIALIYYFVNWLGVNYHYMYSYCWITNSLSAGIIIYGIIWLNISLNFYFTSQIIITLNKMEFGNEEEKQLARRSGLKMLIYPGSQLAIYIIPTIHYIYSVTISIDGVIGKSVFFDSLNAFMLCFQGIALPLVFGYNSEITKAIRNCCRPEYSIKEGNSVYDEKPLIELNSSDYSEVFDI